MVLPPTLTIFAGISGMSKRHFLKQLISKSGAGRKTLLIDFEKDLIADRGQPPILDMPTFLNRPHAGVNSMHGNLDYPS